MRSPAPLQPIRQPLCLVGARCTTYSRVMAVLLVTFDAVVLLRAPADVILERVATRETNEFGKRDVERDRILNDLAKVEPLLRAGATAEIDTRAPLGEVVDALERMADTIGAAIKDGANALRPNSRPRRIEAGNDR